ncbi:MAG: hypothetical protein ACQESN_06860 [Thermotogota bacterium]
MIALYIVAGLSVVLSFIFDKQKTYKGLKMGMKKFFKILPNYLMILIIIAFVLLISEDLIIDYLTQNTIFIGMISALIIGSVTMMPGFIAYPLAGILVEKGVPFMVVSAFVSSLMLVGVVTYPVEKEYMGVKATVYRNIGAFFIAGMIAIITGLFYGEVSL